MGTLLILAGLAGLIVGGISLIRPIQRLRIATRKQAGVVTAASFVIVMIGGALSPTDASNQSAPPTSSFDTSASTSTDAPDTSSSGDQPATFGFDGAAPAGIAMPNAQRQPIKIAR